MNDAMFFIMALLYATLLALSGLLIKMSLDGVFDIPEPRPVVRVLR